MEGKPYFCSCPVARTEPLWRWREERVGQHRPENRGREVGRAKGRQAGVKQGRRMKGGGATDDDQRRQADLVLFVCSRFAGGTLTHGFKFGWRDFSPSATVTLPCFWVQQVCAKGMSSLPSPETSDVYHTTYRV